MGGMAAQIPIKNDPAANEAAIEKVRADKVREATDGCDGTWVAHPGPGGGREGGVRPAHAGARTRSTSKRDDVKVTATRSSRLPAREADHRGGAAQQHQRRHPVHRRLARRQRLRARLQPDGGRRHRRDLALADLAVDPEPQGRARGRPQGHARSSCASCCPRSWQRSGSCSADAAGTAGRYEEAARLFERLTTADEYVEFLTLPGYEWLTRAPPRARGRLGGAHWLA